MRISRSLTAILTTALLTAGCGGGSPSAGASAAAQRSAAADRGMLEYVSCMRRRGIVMADPYHRPGHTGLSIDLPQQDPATTLADKACGRFLAPLAEAKEAKLHALITPGVRLGLIRYAQCMRAHAVPMLDPDGNGILNLGNVPGINSGFGRYSPQFRAADHGCRPLLPASIHDDGTGP